MKVVWLFVVLWAVAQSELTSFEGYKVYEVHPKNVIQINVLKLLQNIPSFDFWSELRAIGEPTTIMVGPSEHAIFTSILNWSRISYELLIENVEAAVSAERVRQQSVHKLAEGKIGFTRYHRFNEIQDYVEQVAENYPEIVTLENIGTSFEGRSLPMIKISSGGNDKPIILIEAGIHAREWISPAFALYTIQELVENTNNQNLIQDIDWYIIPVLNPDGYEHSHANSRLWRKTRSPGNILCRGVDGNRNFDFRWMEVGASSFACLDTYAGSSPFSEPETAAFRDVVLRDKERIKLYLSIHSFGNMILYPWGYTSALPENVEELNALGIKSAAAIASVSGTSYRVGSATQILFSASGVSFDWVKAVGGVELSYTFELPGGGIFGFDLPASRILDVCVETFKGIKVYHDYIVEKFVK